MSVPKFLTEILMERGEKNIRAECDQVQYGRLLNTAACPLALSSRLEPFSTGRLTRMMVSPRWGADQGSPESTFSKWNADVKNSSDCGIDCICVSVPGRWRLRSGVHDTGDRGMVPNAQQAFLESPRFDFWSRLDDVVYLDGHCRLDRLEAGMISRGGRPADAVFAATPLQLRVVVDLLQAASGGLGGCRSGFPLAGDRRDDADVLPKVATRRLATRSLPGLGQFCWLLELHDLANECRIGMRVPRVFRFRRNRMSAEVQDCFRSADCGSRTPCSCRHGRTFDR